MAKYTDHQYLAGSRTEGLGNEIGGHDVEDHVLSCEGFFSGFLKVAEALVRCVDVFEWP